MDLNDRQRIAECAPQLKIFIQFDRLLPFLRESGIFTTDMLLDIEICGLTEEERLDMLLKYLPKRGPTAYQKFINCLTSSELFEAANLLQDDTNIDLWDGEVVAASNLYNGEALPVANIYPMRSKPRGVVLILSFIEFHGKLNNRVGGAFDVANLERLFKQLDFVVDIHHDLTDEDVKPVIASFKNDPRHLTADAAIICCLSHGNERGFYCSNSEIIETDWFLEQFNNINCIPLRNKPKIFFLQHCRGDDIDFAIELDGHFHVDSHSFSNSVITTRAQQLSLATWSDMKVCYSTSKKKFSLRSGESGTLFICTLCDVLSKKAHNTHLDDMLKEVTSIMLNYEIHGWKQSTEISDRGQIAMFTWSTVSLITCFVVQWWSVHSIDISLLVPWPIHSFFDDGGFYRLVYQPPVGFPPTNISYGANDLPNRIDITRALPGTEYQFMLYYSNQTDHDIPFWRSSYVTEPDPPTNLDVVQRTGKNIQISWDAPSEGGLTQYVLRVVRYPDLPSSVQLVHIESQAKSYNLDDLIPGATYELRLSSAFENKESLDYLSLNATTRPNNPGRFIVWFRNETTLLVLWQPPYPAGVFSHYRVSIEPRDALESILLVEKEGEPPGPAQAAFNGLVPGKAYNISVQTVSEDQVSLPTTAQYRTVPLAPRNVTFDKTTLSAHSFAVHWEPPLASSEFDRYQVSLGIKKTLPVVVGRFDDRTVRFEEDLDPGVTYEVVVKTVSGNVFSWPTSANVTTRPLPVSMLNATSNDLGEIMVQWVINNASTQDLFNVRYQEMDSLNGDGGLVTAKSAGTKLKKLFGGRNYSISVTAVSHGIESELTVLYHITGPAPPLIVGLEPLDRGLNLTWKSDVTSLQDSFAVMYTRNDTGESVKQFTTDGKATLRNLYPGATYTIKVFAISYNLWSEAYTRQQTVYPEPPQHLEIELTTNTSLSLKWKKPSGSLFDSYIVTYRSTTGPSDKWTRIDGVKEEKIKVNGLMPGFKYQISVYTMSNRLESKNYQQLQQVIKANPIKGVETLLDTLNVTFEWTVPPGHIDHFLVSYSPVNGGDELSKRVFANATVKDKASVVISELKPGQNYRFVFYSVSFDERSDPFTIETRTVPVINSDVSFIYMSENKRTLGLRFTQTPAAASVFDKYRFQLSDSNIPVQEKNVNDTNRFVTFQNLVPGRLYNVSVWTVSGGIASLPLYRQERLHPESIVDIEATSISDSEITLTWDSPPGDHDSYQVQYLSGDNRLIQNLTVAERITVTQLLPHREYTFTIVVRSGTEATSLKTSEPFSKSFTTAESVPGKLRIFEAKDIKPNEVTLAWSLPMDDRHGVLLGFTITYSEVNSARIHSQDFSSKDTSGTITQLVPGGTYLFKIQAKTKIGYGPVTEIREEIPIWPPPQPSPHFLPTEVSRTSNTLRIRYRKSYFSNANGLVIAYAIIVAEDEEKDANGLDLPSWQDVQDYKLWPPYQANEPYYPFNGTSVEEFEIGVDDSCIGRKGYCNGPLRPGAAYKVKVRAYTSAEKFSDTAYSSAIYTDEDGGSVSAVVIGVLVPILLLAIAIAVILILKRRRFGLFMNKTNNARGKDDNLSIPESIIETSRPVKMKDFIDHFRLMSADSDFRFSEEYEELKNVGRDEPCTAADLPVNRPKNRFTNILPYDHSRVKLLPTDDEEGSDYINANYVPGFNSPREFIVTQGPLHSTHDDFWRMVWEQNCRAIVMLTRCIEKGREKCDHYWPYDTQPVYYGDIQATILNESQYPDWTVTEMKVSRGDTSRLVKHYHFTTWPDFGVPDPPQTLIRFVRAFRERNPPDQRPIICHCSAGVGRSGTFIALDRILQHIIKYDYVDIFGIVFEMRKERVWMVQTEQQYICIHQCLVCVLEGKEDENPPRGEIHDNEGFEDDEGIAESGM
ncbi:hypothetical protein CHUAL_000390 [Chamberlinius hualienensis]